MRVLKVFVILEGETLNEEIQATLVVFTGAINVWAVYYVNNGVYYLISFCGGFRQLMFWGFYFSFPK